jgi:hypothetical protein
LPDSFADLGQDHREARCLGQWTSVTTVL